MVDAGWTAHWQIENQEKITYGREKRMKDIQNVLVVGAGVMGHGLAQIFALNDLDVFLVDKNRVLLDRAEVWIRENLEFMVELKLLQPRGVENTLARITTTTDLDGSAGKADYVLEAISENLDWKKEIFKQLGTAAGSHIILATNTSSYDINELAAVTRSGSWAPTGSIHRRSRPR